MYNTKFSHLPHPDIHQPHRVVVVPSEAGHHHHPLPSLSSPHSARTPAPCPRSLTLTHQPYPGPRPRVQDCGLVTEVARPRVTPPTGRQLPAHQHQPPRQLGTQRHTPRRGQRLKQVCHNYLVLLF